jgi:hypothetical protein
LFAIIEFLHGGAHVRASEARIARKEDGRRTCFAVVSKGVCARRVWLIKTSGRT